MTSLQGMISQIWAELKVHESQALTYTSGVVDSVAPLMVRLASGTLSPAVGLLGASYVIGSTVIVVRAASSKPILLPTTADGSQADLADAAVAALLSASGSATRTAMTAGVSFTFSQATPAAVWTISHPLAFRPAVTVVDSAGTVVEGDVTYPSATQVQVTFSAAFSGTAYLS